MPHPAPAPPARVHASRLRVYETRERVGVGVLESAEAPVLCYLLDDWMLTGERLERERVRRVAPGGGFPAPLQAQFLIQKLSEPPRRPRVDLVPNRLSHLPLEIVQFLR